MNTKTATLQTTGRTDIASLSDAQLLDLEKRIARKYIGGLSIPMVIWPFVNTLCWFALWPLVITGSLPLWAAFPIAFANVLLAYLPSHEAQHSIYARPGEKLRWLNEAIGHFAVIPLAYSYRILRETHMLHHKHTNDPELDPDYAFNKGDGWWETFKICIASYQPGTEQGTSYARAMQRLGTAEAGKAVRDQIAIALLQLGVLLTMAWYGMALEALLLWWLPVKLAVIYIRVYLSWLPHRHNEIGRYRETQGFRSWLGVWSSLGMTAHIVHHLYPRIPLDRTPAALRELTPVLRQRGCELVD